MYEHGINVINEGCRGYFGKRRVIVFGETGVGKTALLNNLMRLLDSCDTVPTDGVTTKQCHMISRFSSFCFSEEQLTGSCISCENEKDVSIRRNNQETGIPPPTVQKSSKQNESSEDIYDLCVSACFVTFFLFLGLLQYGIWTLFFAVLITLQLRAVISTGEICFRSVPRIVDSMLFLMFANNLMTLVSLEEQDNTKLNSLFLPRFIVLFLSISAAQFHCRFGIIVALSFFRFTDSRNSNFICLASRTVYSDCVNYYQSLFSICIICLSLVMFIVLIRFTALSLKIISIVVTSCICLLQLVSCFQLLGAFSIFILAISSLTFMSILTINIANCYCIDSDVIKQKLHYIGPVIGVISAYVFGLENITSNPRNLKSYFEICFNLVMVLVLYHSPTNKIKENVHDTKFDKSPSTPSNIITRNVGYFTLNVLEFSGNVQFENFYHDFVTQGDVYIFVFKLQRAIHKPEDQCNILSKSLQTLKTQGIFDRPMSLLIVGTHKKDVTQPYIDKLSDILELQINSGEWGRLATNGESIFYSVDNSVKDVKQVDVICQGLWSRLLEVQSNSLPLEYKNLRGESIQLVENVVAIVTRLFTSTNIVEGGELGNWINESRLYDICRSQSVNLLKELQDLDLIAYKPKEGLCLVPSLLPVYSRCTNVIWEQRDGDAVFYIDFQFGFHRAVFHLIILHLLEEIRTSKLPFVYSNIAYLCDEGQSELLLEMIVTEMQNLMRISIRKSCECNSYLTDLNLILNCIKEISKQASFRRLSYRVGIVCPSVSTHDVQHTGFHLLQLASNDVSLPQNTDATIQRECCNKVHAWHARNNKVTSVVNLATLTFRNWPQEVVKIVCDALNKNQPYYKNWRGLAGALGYIVDFVDSLEGQENQTMTVLKQWDMKSTTPPTLADLINLLEEAPMERRDIIRDINDYLNKKQ